MCSCKKYWLYTSLLAILGATGCSEASSDDDCDTNYVAFCTNNEYSSCQNGKVVKTPCPNGCTTDAKSCASAKECDDTTFIKTCTNGIFTTCFDGKKMTIPCEKGCNTAGDFCASGDEPIPQKDCDSATHVNTCTAGVLTKCVNNEYVTENCLNGCAADGKSCDGGSVVVPECDSATHINTCASGVLTKCVNNKYVTENCSNGCAADGKSCAIGGETDLTCKNGAGTKPKGEVYQQFTYTGCACDENYVKTCGVVDGKEVAFTCYFNKADSSYNEEYLPCEKCRIENNRYECGDGGGGTTGDFERGSVTPVEASYAELAVKAESDANKSLEKFGTTSSKENQFTVETCAALPATSGNNCTKTGSGSTIVLQGDILTKDKLIKGGSVVVSGNKITYVGCTPDTSNATVITCADSVISAGLINAHDHITYDNQAPDDWKAERFDARNDWRRDSNGHTNHNAKSNSKIGSTNDPGELRQLLAGSTSIFGSGCVKGLQRDFEYKKDCTDEIDKLDGASRPTYDTFPLNDSDNKYCNYSSAICSCSTYKYATNLGGTYGYGPHVGEGINDYALSELNCISGIGANSKNGLNSKLAVIHGVAATPQIIGKMAAAKSKLIWSPRSNISLYGDTARVTVYDNMGVTIALGTDWVASGSANMLREYECADFLNSYYFNHHFTDYDIWMMGTWNAALALGVSNKIGDLAQGMLADIAIYAKNGKEAHRAVIESDYKYVALVMLNGKMVSGDANIMSSGESVTIGGVAKRVDTTATGATKTYSTIKGEAKYPVFFDGVPTGEPTCVPMRTRVIDTTGNDINGDKKADIATTMYDGEFSDPLDRDGDGIPDSVDNCPDIFNPVRPQDKDKDGKLGQSDWDGDGVGDVCDKYPLDATKQ